MKKARLRIEKRKDIFLHNTVVSNLFINEQMPQAPGDYVKVYLFGLMYAQNDREIILENIGKDLGLSENDVIKAFEYWARRKVVRFIRDEKSEEIEIEYINLIDELFGKSVSAHQQERQEQALDNESQPAEELTQEERLSQIINDSIRQLYQEAEEATGRLLSVPDMDKIKDGIKVYGISYDVFSYAIKYCKEIEKYSIDYISKVALRWSQEGCTTIGDVRELLDKYSKKNAYYSAVFREVGFSRLPNSNDKAIMDQWIDEWGFTLAEVLDACKKSAGKRDISLNYVGAILNNQMKEKGGINTAYTTQTKADRKDNLARVSNQVLKDYYAYLREYGEKLQRNRTAEVCGRIPEMSMLYDRMDELNAELLSTAFGSSKEKRNELRERKQSLEEEKKQLLKDNGYEVNYLERKYKCHVCKDTGTTENGAVCQCAQARAEEAYRWMTERNKH